MDNTVISYYSSVNGMQFSKQSFDLLDLWKKNWQTKGWNPIILDEEYAKKHPIFDKISIKDFSNVLHSHTTNLPTEYVMQCYLRWLAYHNYIINHGKVLWADYDVYNKGLVYSEFKTTKQFSKIFCRSCCSGILDFKFAEKFILILENILFSKEISELNCISAHSRNTILKYIEVKNLTDMQLMRISYLDDGENVDQITYSFKKSDGDILNYKLYHIHGGVGSEKNKESIFIDIPYEKISSRVDLFNFIIKKYLE